MPDRDQPEHERRSQPPPAWYDAHMLERRISELVGQIGELQREREAANIRAVENKNAFQRIEERIASSQKAVDDRVMDLGRQLTRVETEYEKDKLTFVTKTEFAPVQRSVFTLIGTIVLGMLAAVMRLVVK